MYSKLKWVTWRIILWVKIQKEIFYLLLIFKKKNELVCVLVQTQVWSWKVPKHTTQVFFWKLEVIFWSLWKVLNSELKLFLENINKVIPSASLELYVLLQLILFCIPHLVVDEHPGKCCVKLCLNIWKQKTQ